MSSHPPAFDRLMYLAGQSIYPDPQSKAAALALASLARAMDWQGRRGHVTTTPGLIRDRMARWTPVRDLDAAQAIETLRRVGYITGWQQYGETWVLTIDTAVLPSRANDLDVWRPVEEEAA